MTPDPPAGATRADVIGTVVIVGAALLFVAWRAHRHRFAEHPTEAECVALLDRYTDHLLFQARHGAPTTELERERARAAAREEAARSAEFATCTTRLTRDEVACAMRANGADEFERCLP